jgi:hypothetical protein
VELEVDELHRLTQELLLVGRLGKELICLVRVALLALV